MNKGKIAQIIKNLLSSYNFEQLYLWLAGTAVIPENQDKPMRFEIIMACLFSIPATKFKNTRLTYEAFCKLIETIDDLVYPLVSMMEDYHPFPQMKIIPLFLPEGVRYFFYGTYEYPYLMWKRIIDTYYSCLKSFNCSIYETINKSLLFQTQLIEVFVRNRLSDMNQQKIKVPTMAILNEVATLFVVNECEENTRICQAGDLVKQKDPIQYAINGQLYSIMYVKNKGDVYFWLPFDHYDGITLAIKKIISNDAILENELTFAARQYLYDYIYSTGRILSEVKNIFTITKQCLTESIDYIAKIDEQNILLFKYGNLNDSQHKEAIIKECEESLKFTISEISKHGLVVFEDDVNKLHFNPKVNYWGIVVIDVFQTECIELCLGKDDNIFYYQFDDLCYFLDQVTTFCELYQFFVDDRSILKQRCISLDSISRFHVFFTNKCFTNSGMPLLMCFDPHLGSFQLFDNMFKQLQQSIYAKAYYLLENKYGIIKKHTSGDGFDICDRTTGAGGMGIVIGDILFFIRYPWDDARFVPKDELNVCCNILAPMILDYVSKLGLTIVELCEKNRESSLPPLLRIDLFPREIARNISSFKNIIKEIYVKHPITTKGVVINKGCFIGVVYDVNLLPDFFGSFSDNHGEKEIMSLIFATLISVVTNAKEDKAQTLANNIWDKKIGIQKKGYSMDAIPIIDPILKDYPSPIQLDTIEQKHIEKEISSFLLNQKIKPGIYLSGEAKEICNSIFSFLWNNLIGILSTYQKEALLFIYRQLELIYNYRENIKITVGLQAKNRTEYNLAEKFKKDCLDVQQLQDAVVYLFHVFNSLGTYGSKLITEFEWKKLLALGWWIDEVTYISDAIHFDTANFELNINDLYEICLNYKDSKFNFTAFQNKQASFLINYETQRLTKTSSININNKQVITKDEKIDIHSWLKCIDKALVDDLGFSFSSLQLVESLLLELNSNTMDFPILIFSSQTELCEKLFELISEKSQVKIESIHKCIDFLISYPIAESSPILPSKIRMYEHRLHISPIILNGQLLAYGKQIVSISKRVIFNLLSNGLYPFDLSKYPHIKQAVEAIHKARDKELENRTYQIACCVLGQNMALKNLKNFQSISAQLDKFPECGEIDLLAVNLEKKIIYVIDAKNQHNARTPSGISRENDCFFGDKGHVEQLKKKTQYITDYLQVVLSHFSINSSKGWIVQNAFVSDKMFISGFLEGNDIDFVDINEFEQYLLNGAI